MNSRHIAHIRHTSIDALRLLPFIGLAILPGGTVVRSPPPPSHVLHLDDICLPLQLITLAVKFAPWVLPSPFQRKQVAGLMTSVPPTLTALTPAELRLQQQKRMQLYAGLSQGLRVAVQVTALC